MASQSAIISVGFTQSGTAKKAGTASAALLCGALESANNYAGGSGLLSANLAKTKLPQAQLPLGRVMADGTVLIDPTWYRFLDYIANVQLGGPTGPTMGDISSTLGSTRNSAISAENAVSVVAQTVNANASSLAATVQVAQTNNLSGSTQIPKPVYTQRGIQP